MPYTTKPPPIPSPEAALVDPETGKLTPVWYQFIIKLVAWCVAGFAAIP